MGGLAGPALVCVTLLAVAACRPDSPPLVREAENATGTIVFRGADVFDAATGTLVGPRDVFVEDDRITRNVVSGDETPTPSATIVDARGKTLLAGLVDMHVHVAANPAPPWVSRFGDADANLRAFLYCGVTTVVDLGDMHTQAFERRERVAKGELLGPRIFAAGPMVTPVGGHPVAKLQATLPWWARWFVLPRFAIEVETQENARDAARRVVDMGADLLKLVIDQRPLDGPRMDDSVVGAAVSHARKRGLRAIAHVGTTADALTAAREGVAALAHSPYKERIPDEKIAELASFGIPVVATLEVYDRMGSIGVEPRESTVLEREIASEAVLSSFDVVPDRWREAFTGPVPRLVRAQRHNAHDNVRRLHEAGVTILVGSDTNVGVFPGAGLHREMANLAAVGLSNSEVIRAATFDAARFLAGSDDPDFGLIAEGKRADLILVDGDPLADLDALSRISSVVVGGVLLERRPR